MGLPLFFSPPVPPSFAPASSQDQKGERSITPSAPSTRRLRVFGRVQGPPGKDLDASEIVVIPWTLGEWDQPIPDHPPKIRRVQGNKAGRFAFEAGGGRPLRGYARNPGLGLVSAVHLRVAPGQALKLNLFPASKLSLPSTPRQAYSWILLGLDRESQRPFLFLWGIQHKGSAEREILLPPGRFQLRLVRRDAASASLDLALAPAEKTRVEPSWERPAFLRTRRTSPKARESLLLPPLFSPPGAGRLPIPEKPGLLRVPTLQGLVLRSWIQTGEGLLRAIDLGPFQPGERKSLLLPAGGQRSLTVQLPPSRSSAWAPRQMDILWWDRGRRVRRQISPPGKGHFRIVGIPKGGPIVLVFEDSRGRISYLSTPEGEGSFSLRPDPKPPAGLDLQVFSPDGMPAGSHRIQVQALEIPGLSQGAIALLGPWNRWTDPRGRLQLRGLPQGAYRVHVPAGLHNEWNKEIRLHSQDLARLRIQLTTGYHLEGVVVDPRGEPVSGALVELSSERIRPTFSPRRTTTDSKGRFRFLGLGEPPYFLEAILVRGAESFLARRRGIQPGKEGIRLILKPEDPKNPFKKKGHRD